MVYRSKQNDCADLVIEVFESSSRVLSLTLRLNRWTHVSVVFNSLTEKPSTSLYRCDISVYMNGLFQDSVTTTRHITVLSLFLSHAGLAPPPHRQRRLRRQPFPRRRGLRGRSFALSLSRRCSAARWSLPRCSVSAPRSRSRTRCWSRCCSSRSCDASRRCCSRTLRATRCSGSRWTSGRASCSARRKRWERECSLTQYKSREQETESPEEILAQKELEARLAAQRARHAPKQEKETIPAEKPPEDLQEDLQGNTVVFFDTSGDGEAE